MRLFLARGSRHARLGSISVFHQKSECDFTAIQLINTALSGTGACVVVCWRGGGGGGTRKVAKKFFPRHNFQMLMLSSEGLLTRGRKGLGLTLPMKLILGKKVGSRASANRRD